MLFSTFSAFSILYSISVIFQCFPYRGKFATLQVAHASLSEHGEQGPGYYLESKKLPVQFIGTICSKFELKT